MKIFSNLLYWAGMTAIIVILSPIFIAFGSMFVSALLLPSIFWFKFVLYSIRFDGTLPSYDCWDAAGLQLFSLAFLIGRIVFIPESRSLSNWRKNKLRLSLRASFALSVLMWVYTNYSMNFLANLNQDKFDPRLFYFLNLALPISLTFIGYRIYISASRKEKPSPSMMYRMSLKFDRLDYLKSDIAYAYSDSTGLCVFVSIPCDTRDEDILLDKINEAWIQHHGSKMPDDIDYDYIEGISATAITWMPETGMRKLSADEIKVIEELCYNNNAFTLDMLFLMVDGLGWTLGTPVPYTDPGWLAIQAEEEMYRGYTRIVCKALRMDYPDDEVTPVESHDMDRFYLPYEPNRPDDSEASNIVRYQHFLSRDLKERSDKISRVEISAIVDAAVRLFVKSYPR